jgi:hypothetical protein
MRRQTLAPFAAMLMLATAAAADTFNCHTVGINPSKDYPNCANTASCNGVGYRWSNRSACEITCMGEGTEPGELIDVGVASCQVIGDDGGPDCGGWPCI